MRDETLRNKIFNEGMTAKQLSDNPYWKDYPENDRSKEADKGRIFVDGWVKGRKNEKVS